MATKNQAKGTSVPVAQAPSRKKILNNQQVLTSSQKNEIKKAFDFFDISGSGTIEAKNLKVVLRALGFDPSNEEISNLIRDLGNGKENAKFDETKIDFQEFLEIMIVKMSQKDSNEDIQKAYRLFVDEEAKVITKKSLTKVVEDLEEDLTEQQIEQLIFGANNKSIEEKDNIKEELTVN